MDAVHASDCTLYVRKSIYSQLLYQEEQNLDYILYVYRRYLYNYGQGTEIHDLLFLICSLSAFDDSPWCSYDTVKPRPHCLLFIPRHGRSLLPRSVMGMCTSPVQDFLPHWLTELLMCSIKHIANVVTTLGSN